jgi:hypothetical protein
MATRLGWTQKKQPDALRSAPVSPRARSEHKHGVALEERAQVVRAEQISAARRRELDAIAVQIPNDTERRYLASVLRSQSHERQQWRREAEAHLWKASELAEVWSVTRQQAHRRIKQLRD